MNRILSLICLTFPALASQAAEEKFHAEAFHQQHCTGCHDASVYTREDRRVHSRQQLESQVRMCDANLGIKLFEDDILALTDFLDYRYYHFAP